MGKALSVRDPLHGFVELTEHERAVVNTRPFQRLRDIHQLGMGHMVYPGANHTRFEHSLGVVHISTRMFRRIVERADAGLKEVVIQDEAKLLRTLRLASLLHDVGHAPFSHAGEHMFVPPSVDLGVLDSKERKKILRKHSHETMTANLIREKELSGVIRGCGCDVEEVIYVATERELSGVNGVRHDLAFANMLLTGELGSDRCDYLLRDSHHSGQPGGQFDIERLIHQMTLVEKNGVVLLGLQFGGWIAAEQMIAGRYAAYVNLYFHKAKRAYEQHLVGFLENHLPNGRLPQEPGEFLGTCDSQVLSDMARVRDGNGLASQHARAVLDRSHYRVAFERVAADRRVVGRGTDSKALSSNDIEAFAENIRNQFGSSVFVDILEHSATKMRRPDLDHKILIQTSDRVQYLDEYSEIVRGMDDSIWRLRVHADEKVWNHVKQSCGKAWETMKLKKDGA